jgi:hypothetical protein
MPQDTLRQGFALAHRRIGLIFVDLLWKAIWFAVTVAVVMLWVMWFGVPLGSIQWQQSNIPGVNAWLLATLVRQLWQERGTELLLAAFGVFSFSVLVWFVLEAFFRSRILPSPSGRLGERLAFGVFLASNAVKTILLAAATTTIGMLVFGSYMATPFSEWHALWLDTRGAALAGFATFLGLAFFLTMIDTLVRCDAIELFGMELLHVSTVIGVLLLFESMIRASLVIVVAMGLLNISSGSDVIVMIGVAFLAVVFWTLIHSYLLLVRFSAVGIMRRNGVDI